MLIATRTPSVGSILLPSPADREVCRGHVSTSSPSSRVAATNSTIDSCRQCSLVDGAYLRNSARRTVRPRSPTLLSLYSASHRILHTAFLSSFHTSLSAPGLFGRRHRSPRPSLYSLIICIAFHPLSTPTENSTPAVMNASSVAGARLNNRRSGRDTSPGT